MSTGKRKDLWDISGRPSTKTKLEIIGKCFDVWLTIWNKQSWASDEWYAIDLFAGRGHYMDGKCRVNGSPLIFLQTIVDKKETLKKKVRIKLFLVEKDKANFECLRGNIGTFLKEHPGMKERIEIFYFNDDCNKVIKEIVSHVRSASNRPLFVLIDPSGLQIKKATIEYILKLENRKDIMFNYILEGVRRTGGIARKAHRGAELSVKEIHTLDTLKEFIGPDINVINASDRKILIDYVDSLFTCRGLNVVAYDVPYPDRNDVLYYLLFASRKPSITSIVKDIYAKQKENSLGPTLFGKELFRKNILTALPQIREIERKSLLYKTQVEYGNWTINHIEGCMHGCRFPCYAFMMSKKFGRVKDYDDWRKPKIVVNAMRLLEGEIIKYKNQIDFVHLSFMTDPFMFDAQEGDLVPEVKSLTLEIIERLNSEGARVTTLTKGFYPGEILGKRFSKDNEYGITLVSLSDKFKRRFEPFSASYERRINSLRSLKRAGLRTWVSIEPYPTPNLDETSRHVEELLKEISFVDKIVFGRLNYNVKASRFLDNENFYREMAKKVIEFCQRNGIKYHVKIGTPCSQEETKSIFMDKAAPNYRYARKQGGGGSSRRASRQTNIPDT